MTEAELEAALQKAAATYLNRFAPSVYQFRQMLIRKCRKLSTQLTPDIIEIRISAEIERRLNQGILNDKSYAENWARKMHGSGKSILQIRIKLHQKRIAKEIIQQTIDEISNHKSKFASALLFAKRKRLGPFAKEKDQDAKQRWKELQKMVRVGHNFDIAKTILNGNLDDLERDSDL